MSTLLAPTLDGTILLPGDDGYDGARKIWNAMIDRHPRMIVRCASERDVVTAVRTARELGLDIGVRCGGHSAIGHAVPDDGVMIDLTGLASVRVDPVRKRAWVQGGALLGALDQAAQRHGLATTAGNVSHTGVGGLTLGGGMGWLARRHGLACDNVISYRVVTAEGVIVTASAAENADLYWGLRGGGGNFGIVIEFEFQLHEIGTRAVSVEYDFPIERAAAAFRGWRDLGATASRSATFTADLSKGVVTLGYIWVGDPAEARTLLPQFDSLGHHTQARVLATSYLDLQSRNDVVGGHAKRRYGKGHYLRELTDDAIDAILDGMTDSPFAPGVGLQAYGGAIADVPDDASAFSHRSTAFELGAGSAWTDPDEDADRMAAARAYAAPLERFASGAYVNALGDDSVARAYSPEKLVRLAELKRVWDPDNTFHLNHNIRPTTK